MIRFAAGIAILCFTLILGLYTYADRANLVDIKQRTLRETEQERENAKNLQNRIAGIRRLSIPQGDDQKFTLERLLNIGAPGLELRFIGQPRISSGNRSLYRHTFRISGPATFADALETTQRMSTLPGFAVYKFCYACTKKPRDVPAELEMVLIEGYLYVFDPNTLY